MYRIVKWEERYENNRTRNMLEMRWVPIPNRFDGDAISEIIDHGAAVYAVWVMIVLIASRCSPRGELIRENGEPHTPKTLARRTRFKQTEIEKAFPLLISAGLIERYSVAENQVAPERQEGAGDTAPDRQAPAGIRHPTDYGMEGNGREWKGIERKNAPAEPVTVESLTVPDSINTPDALEALSDWLDYKRSRREGYKKAGHLNGLLKTYSDPETLARDIRHSIGSGYKGLITAPGSANRQPAKKQIFKMPATEATA